MKKKGEMKKEKDILVDKQKVLSKDELLKVLTMVSDIKDFKRSEITVKGVVSLIRKSIDVKEDGGDFVDEDDQSDIVAEDYDDARSSASDFVAEEGV
jgi:hypothetical protein